MSKAIKKKEVTEENTVICALCEEIISKDDSYLFQNEYYCLDCLNEISSICVHCGERISEEEVCMLNGEAYCEDCYDEYTFVCDRCEHRFENEENMGDINIDLCRNCYDDYYTRCNECGSVIHNEDANYFDAYNETPYCDECFRHECDIRYLHDYGYKPDPVFRGNGNRFFGCELEIDGAGKDEDNAQELCEAVNMHAENIYIKTDSSLNDGMEIVTHPMTLEYHMKNMPWSDVCRIALHMGYRSHNTSTCGLHIHINRTAFGETIEEQEECIARVLYFFESNWNELLKFSRRTENQLNHWAKRYGWQYEPKAILDDAKKCYSGRYVCVNITNYSTIEIRIFRGTLKFNTIHASIQLADAICDTAIFMSDSEIKNLAWSTFVSELDKEKYPELIRYLKERRLYVNETVDLNTERGEE